MLSIMQGMSNDGTGPYPSYGPHTGTHILAWHTHTHAHTHTYMYIHMHARTHIQTYFFIVSQSSLSVIWAHTTAISDDSSGSASRYS